MKSTNVKNQEALRVQFVLQSINTNGWSLFPVVNSGTSNNHMKIVDGLNPALGIPVAQMLIDNEHNTKAQFIATSPQNIYNLLTVIEQLESDNQELQAQLQKLTQSPN